MVLARCLAMHCISIVIPISSIYKESNQPNYSRIFLCVICRSEIWRFFISLKLISILSLTVQMFVKIQSAFTETKEGIVYQWERCSKHLSFPFHLLLLLLLLLLLFFFFSLSHYLSPSIYVCVCMCICMCMCMWPQGSHTQQHQDCTYLLCRYHVYPSVHWMYNIDLGQ